MSAPKYRFTIKVTPIKILLDRNNPTGCSFKNVEKSESVAAAHWGKPSLTLCPGAVAPASGLSQSLSPPP